MNQSEKWEIFYSVIFIKSSIHVLFYFYLFIVLVVFVIQEEYSEKRKEDMESRGIAEFFELNFNMVSVSSIYMIVKVMYFND